LIAALGAPAQLRTSVGLRSSTGSGVFRIGFPTSPPPAVPARLLTPHALFFELSAKDRKDMLEEICKAIEEGYYDPGLNGVDWKAVRERYLPMIDAVKTDQEFYQLMERMAGELHDAHTHVLSPVQ